MKYKKIFLLYIASLITVLSYSLCWENIANIRDGWEFQAAVITMIITFFSILVWNRLGLNFMSPSFLMFIALILFHLGTVVVVGFKLVNIEYPQNLMIYRYGENLTVPAVLYSLSFLMLYLIGIIIFYSNNRIKEIDQKKISLNIDKEITACRKIGVIFLVISLPATIYVNAIQIISRMKYGYSAVYSADYTLFGISLGLITNLFLPGIIFIIVGLQKNKKKCVSVTMSSSLYFFANMFLSGRRADGILAIIAIIFTYKSFFKFKVNFFQICASYIIIAAISFIAQTRGSVLELNEIIQLFWLKLTQENLVVELILEMGGTIRSPILVMEALKSSSQFRYGLVYLLGPIAVTLKALRITDILNNFISFDYFLKLPERGSLINHATENMGGSAIAEWYFNFGWVGIPLAILFAGFILRYQELFSINKYKPFKYSITCFSLYLVMLYSRGFFAGMFWILIYVTCISYTLYRIIDKTSH